MLLLLFQPKVVIIAEKQRSFSVIFCYILLFSIIFCCFPAGKHQKIGVPMQPLGTWMWSKAHTVAAMSVM